MSDYLSDLARLAPYFLAVLGCGVWLGWSLRARRSRRDDETPPTAARR